MVEFLVNNNKGKITFGEAYNMNMRLFHTLCCDTRKMLIAKSEEAAQKGEDAVNQQRVADAIEEVIDEEVGI